jgi:hypothetical protein
MLPKSTPFDVCEFAPEKAATANSAKPITLHKPNASYCGTADQQPTAGRHEKHALFVRHPLETQIKPALREQRPRVPDMRAV